MTIHLTSYQVEYKPVSTWLAFSDDAVLSCSGRAEMSGNSEQGLGFGDTSSTTFDLSVLRTALSGVTLPRLPVRVSYTVDGNTNTHMGFVQSYAGDRFQVRLTCPGIIDDIPNRTKDLYSPMFYRRPAATKTTATSIEDPSNPNYVGGPINYVCWKAEGRPWEQAGSYPTAPFYYSCDQAILAPDWAWIAGEDGWGECLRLARACGGQLFQGMDGVVRYRSPLTMIGTPVYTFTADTYGDITEEGSTGQYFASATCSFTPRSVRPMQEVINDATPRKVEPSETVTIPLEPQWPITSFLSGTTLTTLPAEHLVVTRYDGEPSTAYSHTVTLAAQRVSISFTNNEAIPVVIYRIIVHGTPVVAGETQTVTAGSGQPTKLLEDNPFVQNRHHAQQYADMCLAFYGTVRPIRTLSGCPYDAERSNGEAVYVTSAELGLSSALHVILSMDHSETGKKTDYTVVDASGLPVLADYYVVSTTAQSTTKRLAW
jgi:hypothetical protein